MEAAIQRRYITIIASLQRIIMYCTLPRCEVMWTNFLSNTASRFCVPLRLFHLLFSSLASVLQYEFGDILLHNLLPPQPLCQGWNHLNNSPNRRHLHFIRMQENIYLYVKCMMWYKKKTSFMIAIPLGPYSNTKKPKNACPCNHGGTN